MQFLLKDIDTTVFIRYSTIKLYAKYEMVCKNCVLL